MPQNQKTPTASQELAGFLMDNCDNPYTGNRSQKKSYPGHYRGVERLLDDRVLIAHFCDINRCGAKYPNRKSRLEITIKPTQDYHAGQETIERGLDGQLDETRLWRGEFGSRWINVSSDQPEEPRRVYAQQEYVTFLEDVLSVLRKESDSLGFLEPTGFEEYVDRFETGKGYEEAVAIGFLNLRFAWALVEQRRCIDSIRHGPLEAVPEVAGLFDALGDESLKRHEVLAGLQDVARRYMAYCIPRYKVSKEKILGASKVSLR